MPKVQRTISRWTRRCGRYEVRKTTRGKKGQSPGGRSEIGASLQAKCGPMSGKEHIQQYSGVRPGNDSERESSNNTGEQPTKKGGEVSAFKKNEL